MGQWDPTKTLTLLILNNTVGPYSMCLQINILAAEKYSVIHLFILHQRVVYVHISLTLCLTTAECI